MTANLRECARKSLLYSNIAFLNRVLVLVSNFIYLDAITAWSEKIENVEGQLATRDQLAQWREIACSQVN